MKLYKFAFAPFAFLAVACGGGGSSIDLDGKTPAEQAEAVSNTICDSEVACGELNIDVTQEGKTLVCTASFEEVDFDACVAETEPDVLETFENCEFTADELATIEECLNADIPCITQAQADAYCDEIEAGGEPEYPVDIPAACEEMSAIIEACETPA